MTINLGGLSPEKSLAWLVDRVDGRDPIFPKPPLADDTLVTVVFEAWQIRELARSADDALNLRRLVKAMIGDAVKDALK